MMKKIKLFVCDVDGTLTDGTVFVSERGEEMKQFSHRDGRGIRLLHDRGVKVCFVTSEKGGINAARADKLNKLGTLDFCQDGIENGTKVQYVQSVCEGLGIDMQTETVFIGDDTNDEDLFNEIAFCACPVDAVDKVKAKSWVRVMSLPGGRGAVREFVDLLIAEGRV